MLFFQEKSQIDTLHFWDGERKIDMILAFDDDDETTEDRKDYKRETFQRNLEEQGLQLELEPAKVLYIFFPKLRFKNIKRVLEIARGKSLLESWGTTFLPD